MNFPSMAMNLKEASPNATDLELKVNLLANMVVQEEQSKTIQTGDPQTWNLDLMSLSVLRDNG